MSEMASLVHDVEVPIPILPLLPSIVRSGFAADNELLKSKFLPFVPKKSVFAAMAALAFP